ncbi:uncharacterized protein ACNS7B_003081 isoform 1-T1 [Menidia menidia]
MADKMAAALYLKKEQVGRHFSLCNRAVWCSGSSGPGGGLAVNQLVVRLCFGRSAGSVDSGECSRLRMLIGTGDLVLSGIYLPSTLPTRHQRLHTNPCDGLGTVQGDPASRPLTTGVGSSSPRDPNRE